MPKPHHHHHQQQSYDFGYLKPPPQQQQQQQQHQQSFTFPTINVLDFDQALCLSEKIIPGWKYGATFLSTLRQNLHLASALSSPPTSATSTLLSLPVSTAFLPRLPATSPLSAITTLATAQDEGFLVTGKEDRDGVDISVGVATEDAEIRAGLELVRRGLLEDRRRAARAVAVHPVFLVVVMGLVGLVAWVARGERWVLGGVWVLCSVGLGAGVWVATREYAELATGVGTAWLEEGGLDGGWGKGRVRRCESFVVVGKGVGEVVGVVIVRVERRERRGLVRAWVVGRGERGKGVGRRVLGEGVRVAMGERGCRWCEFEGEGVFSKKVLPKMFNCEFDRRDVNARTVLEEVIAVQGRGGSRGKTLTGGGW